MKYGIIKYKRTDIINLGDDIQLLAVKNIYKEMAIKLEQIKYIDFQELWTYKGEVIILPICFPFFGYRQLRITCFSSSIIPVFLSISIMDTDLFPEDIDYLKRFEPIGCRDEHTRNGLRKLGIQAYLNGCMTLTLPKIYHADSRKNKIYCVDVGENVFSFLPNEIRENIVNTSHIISVGDWEQTGLTTENIAENRLYEYCENARLVITTRLHCAVPCIALGIPTILLSNVNSFRFSWLEKITSVYLPNEYSNINWKPERIDYELVKRKILDYAIFRLRSTYDIVNNIDRLSDRQEQIKKNNEKMMDEIDKYFSIREKKLYYIESLYNTITYLKEHRDVLDHIEYAVWGLNQTASLLVKYITVNYPNMKLKAVIDSYQEVFFREIRTKKVEEISNIKELFVFVTADAAIRNAKKYFENIQKKENSYFMCWDAIGLL